MRVETAVIPLGGIGSRWMPATTTTEKCLIPMPIGDEAQMPIDRMLDECAGAVGRIVLVTRAKGEQRLRDYFDEDRLDPDLVAECEEQGKEELVRAERARRASYKDRFGEFKYVIQRPDHEYGTTVPTFLTVGALLETLPDNSKPEDLGHLAVVGGDDFLVPPEGGQPELILAKQTWEAAETDHMVMGVPVSRDEAPHYGVLEVDEDGKLVSLIEKPSPEELDERFPDQEFVLANISRYGFDVGKIFPYVEQEMTRRLSTEKVNGRRDEHFITNVLDEALKAGQSFQVHQAVGTWYDTGRPAVLRETANQLTAAMR